MIDVTRILASIEKGDPKAADELLPLLYSELRKLAAARMANESAGHTLQPTALVHEAWLRLVGDENPNFQNRAHFFAAAAEAMRRILIEKARRKQAQRRGGGLANLNLDDIEVTSPDRDEQLLDLNDALEKLTAKNKLQAELVKLRYFAGMTNDESAKILGITPRAAKYCWTHARAWLYHEISSSRTDHLS